MCQVFRNNWLLVETATVKLIETRARQSEREVASAQEDLRRAEIRADMLTAENGELAEQLAAFKRAARQVRRSGDFARLPTVYCRR